MTTLILAAAGYHLFPAAAGAFTWGSVVGGMVGGIIDNTFMFPPPDVKGPRLNDLLLQSGSEGTAVNFVLGNENRVAGWVIWKGETIETSHERGGKGGGPEVTEYTYSCDIAIAVCENETYRVPRIWANGTLIYDADANISIVSDQISATVVSVFGWYAPGGGVTETRYMELTSPNGGPDLSRLRSGYDAVVSGFGNANDNGTFRVVSSSMDAATGISVVRMLNPNAVTQTSGATVTITQDLPEHSSSKMSAPPTFYYGTETQLADPTIQSYEGVANTPAFRGVTYVVLHNLQLAEFGNTLPQITFDVEESNGSRTLASAVSKILSRSGRPSTDWDVTGLTGNIRGYNIRGAQTIVAQLRPLLLAYDIVTQERRGKIYFSKRASIARTAVASEKVTARPFGVEAKRRMQISEAQSTELPIEVNVTYIDNTNDYQNGSQSYRRFKPANALDNTLTLDLNVTLSPSEAQDIARRVLWTAWANKNRVRLDLPPSELTMSESDVITLSSIDGRDWELLVSRVDRGALDYSLQLEATTEEPQTLDFVNSPAEDASYSAQQVYTTPEMTLIVADFAPFRSDEEEIPGFYWGACMFDTSQLYHGAGLYESSDGTNFALVEDVLQEARIGYATNTLNASGVSAAYVDYKSTVNVRLYNGTLASVTLAEMLDGANRMMIGREVIGFITATLESNGSYTLSGLLRGLYATEHQMTTHNTGEELLVLSAPGVYFRSLSVSDIDQIRYFKVVAAGGILTQFTSRQIRQSCNTLTHFPPCHVRGRKDATSGDWTIYWIRRSRGVFRLFGTTVAPLLDDAERYDVEILNVPETVVLRTVQVNLATSFVYTNAQAIADQGVNPSVLHVRVYAVHSVTGRSRGTTAVLPLT